MSRVMLCHCQAAEESALDAQDMSFVSCDDSEEMLSEVALDPPDVVVYEVRPESVSDLAVLRLLRRIAPRLPLVVVEESPAHDLEVPGELDPLFRAPVPHEPTQEIWLRVAVNSALAAHLAGTR
jgi:hypothetical protein